MRTPPSAPRPAPSRRAVIGASAALPLSTLAVAPNALAPDGSAETVRLCKSWLSTEAHHYDLAGRWCDQEKLLIARYSNWFKMTEAERRRLPDAAELFKIDAQLDVYPKGHEDILPKLAALGATSREAILMKFEVVAAALRLEENEDELRLLDSARRDLEAAWR
jgi:hypothetical protein